MPSISMSQLPVELMALGVVAFGSIVFMRGLIGGKHGEHGLLRRHVTALDRIEGWRSVLIGLTLVGLGLAWRLNSRLLFFLSVCIGYVELQETTHILRACRVKTVRSGSGTMSRSSST